MVIMESYQAPILLEMDQRVMVEKSIRLKWVNKRFYIHFYFIVSGEINVYLVKIKVVSITSEMISYHFTIMIRFIFSLLALGDFGFLHCFRCGSYLHFRFLNTSNFFVS